MEPHGAPWLQPVATRRKSLTRETGKSSEIRCRASRTGLPIEAHGKEGVSVSSPEEALLKRCKPTLFLSRCLQGLQYAVGVEPFMKPSGSERTLQSFEKD